MFSKLPFLSQTPIAVAYTPDSILNSSQKNVPFQLIKNRSRYSTCTDVSWFNNDQNLAVLNFAIETLHIYQFDPQKQSLTLIQTLNNTNGMQLSWPDKFAFSPDGLYLAITNIRSSTVNIYRIKPKTHLIDPIPIHIIKNPIFTLFHGVQFSSDSKYIACTTIEKLGLIYIYRIEKNTDGSLHLAPTQIVQNRYPPSKPKSLHFSRDNSLMIICYSPNADSKTSLQSYGELAIHTFDNVSGTISQQPVYELIGTPELCNPDDVAFSNDDLSSLIIVPCQGNDTIVFYSFDKINHKIDPNFFSFTNPHSQISFPHGLSLTLNNKYLALSNYGDDKVTIYSLNKVSPY